VHRALGPGLLESAYQACLTFERAERGLKVEWQKPLPVIYREVTLDSGYRLETAQPVIARSGSDEAIPKLIVFEGGRLLRYARNDTTEAILRASRPLPRYA